MKKKRGSASGLQTPDPRLQTLPLVIVNPSSAGGATARVWPHMASDLREHFGPFNCVFTERSGDGQRIAAREAMAGRRLIVACGGDGTISEVANGILASAAETELGILPSGTGGDFRRTLGIPTRTADAALCLKEGRTELIDVGRVEYLNRRGELETRFFINVASCGMGGEVVERAKREKPRLWAGISSNFWQGRATYAAAALRTTLTFEKPTLAVSLDQKREQRLVTANFCVANARYFGGGMKITPEAKLNDGLFDVVAIGDTSALDILTNVHRLYLGTHLGMKNVYHAHARCVSVRNVVDEKVLLEVDGELVGTLPATFEILPRALRVRCVQLSK
ncbi:MAG: diacylglycerol kinase family lipid kinase [Acidobacteriota bacterium]|nr:diacylglycerol kinase family lipid kinase [Acidobacteriota bacterium]